MKKVLTLAAVAALSMVGQAHAQVPALVNGNLETPIFNPDAGTDWPFGWRLLNMGQYRVIGDGLTPETITRSGTRSVVLPGALGITGGELQSLFAEEPVSLGVRNWPQFTYSPPNGPAIEISFWFNISASDPMADSRLGVKLSIKRPNTSNYQEIEQLWVDPFNDAAFPGCTKVTLPGDIKAIHTNGQWVQYKAIFSQSQFEYHLFPPPNPTAASFQVLRFGSATSTGRVWIDDVSFKQQCPADFNKDGVTSIDDLFLFINAYFVGCP